MFHETSLILSVALDFCGLGYWAIGLLVGKDMSDIMLAKVRTNDKLCAQSIVAELPILQ